MMIRGLRADFSPTLFELKGVRIYSKMSGEFVDVLKGVYPKELAEKIYLKIKEKERFIKGV